MRLKAHTEPKNKPRRLLIPFNRLFFQVSKMKSITWKPWESKKGRPSLIMIFWKKLVNGFLTLATPGVGKNESLMPFPYTRKLKPYWENC